MSLLNNSATMIQENSRHNTAQLEKSPIFQPIYAPSEYTKTLIMAVILVATAFLSTSVLASSFPIKPFKASYELDWEGGISLSGSTTRTLTKDNKGGWLFDSRASATFAGIKESSRFAWQEGLLTPQQYKFERSVLGKKRTADVSFDWAAGKITNTVANKPWQMPTEPGVQDKLSYQLLLQHDVAQGKTEFSYQVADGGKLKLYQFKAQDTEQISSPLGTFDAIKVVRVREDDNPRKTFIWFAPQLDYQIIKLQQIDKKGKKYTLLLKELIQ